MVDEPSTILHHEVTYPLLSPCEITTEGSATPSDIIYGNLGDANYQNLHLSRVIVSATGSIASPSMLPLSDNCIIPSYLENSPVPITGNAKSRRRLKNRESQRRFRERKEQLQKALQQQVEHSRTEYEELLCKYTNSTTEAALLLQENDSLRAEIKDLRRQRRLMLSVMKALRDAKPSSEEGDAGGLLGDVIHYLTDVSDDPTTPDSN
ncbi:putative bZIP transcription factor [Fusarium austroafricanum]|uniref:Putative bZIP transcription factor n=1 Tax=Fusarium austroafricanum TaxID=2364996 RepID=A0A8H4KIR0_9HYPO|nr:putative bZIP transcription factor [Fusarium austroafricanum]